MYTKDYQVNGKTLTLGAEFQTKDENKYVHYFIKIEDSFLEVSSQFINDELAISTKEFLSEMYAKEKEENQNKILDFLKK